MNGLDLKRWRVVRFLTQAQLGAKLGLKEGSIRAYELGWREIPKPVEMALKWLECDEKRGAEE